MYDRSHRVSCSIVDQHLFAHVLFPIGFLREGPICDFTGGCSGTRGAHTSRRAEAAASLGERTRGRARSSSVRARSPSGDSSRAPPASKVANARPRASVAGRLVRATRATTRKERESRHAHLDTVQANSTVRRDGTARRRVSAGRRRAAREASSSTSVQRRFRAMSVAALRGGLHPPDVGVGKRAGHSPPRLPSRLVAKTTVVAALRTKMPTVPPRGRGEGPRRSAPARCPLLVAKDVHRAKNIHLRAFFRAPRPRTPRRRLAHRALTREPPTPALPSPAARALPFIPSVPSVSSAPPRSTPSLATRTVPFPRSPSLRALEQDPKMWHACAAFIAAGCARDASTSRGSDDARATPAMTDVLTTLSTWRAWISSRAAHVHDGLLRRAASARRRRPPRARPAGDDAPVAADDDEGLRRTRSSSEPGEVSASSRRRCPSPSFERPSRSRRWSRRNTGTFRRAL